MVRHGVSRAQPRPRGRISSHVSRLLSSGCPGEGAPALIRTDILHLSSYTPLSASPQCLPSVPPIIASPCSLPLITCPGCLPYYPPVQPRLRASHQSLHLHLPPNDLPSSPPLTQHNTPQHTTTQRNTAIYSITQHSTTRYTTPHHNTTQHNSPHHNAATRHSTR